MNPLWLFAIVPSAAVFGFSVAAMCVAAGRSED